MHCFTAYLVEFLMPTIHLFAEYAVPPLTCSLGAIKRRNLLEIIFHHSEMENSWIETPNAGGTDTYGLIAPVINFGPLTIC